MKAVILAAGMGNRLGKYTKDNTKAMVELNGKKLIEYTLDSLEKYNVKDVVIVVGYKKENLMSYIGDTYNSIHIKYVENNIYDKTNNIYSLYLAKDELNDDIILLESDIIFDDKAIEKLINSKEKDIVLVDKYEKWMDGTVTTLDEKNYVCDFVDKNEFNWDDIYKYYKTVNIYKLSREFLQNKYMPFLEAHIKSEGVNSYYEQVLKVITRLSSVKLKAINISGLKWYEIDDIQDLDIASALFSKSSVNELRKRYGGYWRFPKVKDFCYLVNPYFPSDKLKNELKASFNELISEYPSGQMVQKLLAARMFNCNIDEIVVGNGAAELIKAISKFIKGRILIIEPTFNEYAERFGDDRIIHYNTSKNNYEYSIYDIIDKSKEASAVVLINPDNPSGHYLSKEHIIKLLNNLKKNSKILILDESFIDFAGTDEVFTMIDSNILNEYNNLIVIKSISKSYGVPGLRLGVLASGNKELINILNKEVSIWNINSFGEYFMQIMGKYKKDYEYACKQIALERDRMYNELKKIEYLDVFPSKSNYFLCYINSNNLNSEKLSNILFTKYSILIKSCSSKKGFDSDKYIRIAVRSKEDNNIIIDALNNVNRLILHK